MVRCFSRLVLESADAPGARQVAVAIVETLAVIGKATVLRIQPYWKIPGTFEVSIEMSLTGNTATVLNSIMSALGTGWEVGGCDDDQFAIWNRPSSGSFAFPSVLWASIDTWGPHEDHSLT